MSIGREGDRLDVVAIGIADEAAEVVRPIPPLLRLVQHLGTQRSGLDKRLHLATRSRSEREVHIVMRTTRSVHRPDPEVGIAIGGTEANELTVVAEDT